MSVVAQNQGWLASLSSLIMKREIQLWKAISQTAGRASKALIKSAEARPTKSKASKKNRE